MSLIDETYHNSKMIEQYRNEEKCSVCGHERGVHKSGTYQCPANDPYSLGNKLWRDTTFKMGE
jgi:DNA repair exonuclease SbcCD ATPase subunit